ncbi:MAG: tripartite tricarboxylate transporter substrate binding protein [Betaproteobacteria bacterium]
MIQFAASDAKWAGRAPRAARCVMNIAVLSSIAAALGFAAVPAAAQSSDPYPSRPVKIIVPYGPGGATDIIARQMAIKLGEALGQGFVVENRPGASGNIALDAVAKAAPDGYTLFVGNVSTNTINETLFEGVMQSRPSRDLIGITKLVEVPHIVAASIAFPPNTIAEAIDYARNNPGKLNYASASLGSYPHLDMLKFLKASGTEMTHVPYKGGAGQMVPSLLTNETQLAFINLSSTIEHIRAGKMKALATTAPSRVPELPNVATMAEQGFAGVGTNAWQGLFAPVATPKPIVDKLFNAAAAILTKPDMKENLARQMLTVVPSKSSQEFTELVQKETREWAEFIRENKIKIE